MLPNPTRETYIEVTGEVSSFNETVERIKQKAPIIGGIIEQDILLFNKLYGKLVDRTLTVEDQTKLLSVCLGRAALIYLLLETQDRKDNE